MSVYHVRSFYFMNKQHFILFDFDGVIADSISAAFEINQKLLPGLTIDEFRLAANGNINDWAKKQSLDKSKKDLGESFFKEYRNRAEDNIQLFAGMDKTIEALAQDYNLTVVSSSLTDIIQKFLDRYCLTDYFIKIMGNEIHLKKKIKIEMILNEYGAKADDCVFVTDTLGDVHEAGQLKIPSIGVGWGLHQPEMLSKKCWSVVDNPTELIDAISARFGK